MNRQDRRAWLRAVDRHKGLSPETRAVAHAMANLATWTGGGACVVTDESEVLDELARMGYRVTQ